MDLTKLMKDLDAAVDDVEAKKATAVEADLAFTSVLEQARVAKQAANEAHAVAVAKARDLRRQLDKLLDSAGLSGPAGVTVNN